MTTLACPDETKREQTLSNVADDFEEILDTPREDKGTKSVRAKEYLKGFLKRYGLPYVCCFVATALITSTNCSKFLCFSVSSPRMWLDFITGPEVDIFIE